MKAGAFTPATRVNPHSYLHSVPSLNEGGGFHPRNPVDPRSILG